jgi:iron complex outermembrane receptor protein
MEEQDRWTGQFGFTFECGFTFYAIEVDWTTGNVLNEGHPCFVRNQLRAVTDSANTMYSGFAQAEVELHRRVRLTAGGRYDRFERESRQENGVPLIAYPRLDGTTEKVSPKAALSVEVAPRRELRPGLQLELRALRRRLPP